MSLQFQQQLKKDTEKKLKSVNLDISILKGLARPSQISKDIKDIKPKAAKLSLNDLSSILLNKNKKFQELKEQKKQAVQWLKYKGVDWRKLNLQVKENAMLAEQQAFLTQQKVLQKRGVQSVIGIKGKFIIGPQKQKLFTKQMQDEFIQSQKQVKLCNIVMNSLKKTKEKNKTRAALFNRIKGEIGSQPREFNLARQLELSQQNGVLIQRKNIDMLKNEYFDFVKALSANGFDGSLHLLKKTRPYWKIILQHVKTIQHYVPQLEKQGIFNEQQNLFQQTPISQYNLRMNQYITIKSLKLVERQFQKRLPDMNQSFDNLDDIVRDMQRRNRKLKIWRNSNGQATWAMTFILLKAGRINQIKRVLESVDRQILSQLVQQHQSINIQKPQKSFKNHDAHKYNDSFYVQIIGILQCSAKFDPLVLINQSQLTKVWLLLRTIGIYRSVPQMNKQFNKLNEKLIDLECNSNEPIDESKIQQFLYMGNYKYFTYLIELIFQNQLPKKEIPSLIYHDYFHMLTVINYFPELWGDSKGKELLGIQKKFTQKLIIYMRRLRDQKYKIQLPSYLLLSSVQRLQEVACRVITNVQQFKQFDWRSLKELMNVRDPKNGKKLHKILLKQVLDQLKLSKFDDYLFAAQAYHIDFPQSIDSLYREQKCYVQLLISYLYFFEKKKQLLRANLSIQQFDNELFTFFGMSQQKNQERDLVKKLNQILNKVKDCEQKLQAEIIKNSNDQEYVSNITIPFEFYKKFSELSKLMQNLVQKKTELKNFKPKWTDTLDDSQKHGFLEGLQPVLLRFLGFQFHQQNYAGLYVYYLNELIDRKKLLCEIDCDYEGVINEARLIAGYLGHLQGYYNRKEEERRIREPKLMGQQRRILIEESTNPLRNCPQYQRLKQSIKRMIGEPIEAKSGRVSQSSGSGWMSYIKRKILGKNVDLSGGEYFREEFGY